MYLTAVVNEPSVFEQLKFYSSRASEVPIIRDVLM